MGEGGSRYVYKLYKKNCSFGRGLHIYLNNQPKTDMMMLKDLQDEIEKHREMYMSLNNTGEK